MVFCTIHTAELKEKRAELTSKMQSRKSLGGSSSRESGLKPPTAGSRRSSVSRRSSAGGESAELTQLRAVLAVTQEEMQELKQTHKAECESLQAQIARLEASSSTDGEGAGGELSVAQLQARHTALQSKLAAANDKIEQQQQQIDKMTASGASQVHAELSLARAQLADALERIEELETAQETASGVGGNAGGSVVEDDTVSVVLDANGNALRGHGALAAEITKLRASLKAAESSAQRRSAAIEAQKQELQSTVESLTLDLEQLSLEKEEAEEKLLDMELQCETVQAELDDQKYRVTELTQQLKAAETAAETSTSGGGEGATGSQTDSAALEEQNARLREALSKLREVTAAEKIDLTTRLRAAEKLASEHAAGAQKAAASSEQVAVLEAQVLELKEQLDVATEYDAMIEGLTENNLELTAENADLRGAIEDLEQLKDVADELEEQQADMVTSLRAELLDMELRHEEEQREAMQVQDELLGARALLHQYREAMEQLQGSVSQGQQAGSGSQRSLEGSSKALAAYAAASDVMQRDALSSLGQWHAQTYSALLPQGSLGRAALSSALPRAVRMHAGAQLLEGIGVLQQHSLFLYGVQQVLAAQVTSTYCALPRLQGGSAAHLTPEQVEGAVRGYIGHRYLADVLELVQQIIVSAFTFPIAQGKTGRAAVWDTIHDAAGRVRGAAEVLHSRLLQGKLGWSAQSGGPMSSLSLSSLAQELVSADTLRWLMEPPSADDHSGSTVDTSEGTERAFRGEPWLRGLMDDLLSVRAHLVGAGGAQTMPSGATEGALTTTAAALFHDEVTLGSAVLGIAAACAAGGMQSRLPVQGAALTDVEEVADTGSDKDDATAGPDARFNSLLPQVQGLFDRLSSMASAAHALHDAATSSFASLRTCVVNAVQERLPELALALPRAHTSVQLAPTALSIALLAKDAEATAADSPVSISRQQQALHQILATPWLQAAHTLSADGAPPMSESTSALRSALVACLQSVMSKHTMTGITALTDRTAAVYGAIRLADASASGDASASDGAGGAELPKDLVPTLDTAQGQMAAVAEALVRTSAPLTSMLGQVQWAAGLDDDDVGGEVRGASWAWQEWRREMQLTVAQADRQRQELESATANLQTAVQRADRLKRQLDESNALRGALESRFAAVREQEAIVDKLKDQVREQEALRAQITRLEEDLAKKPTEVTSTPLESQQPTASPASKATGLEETPITVTEGHSSAGVIRMLAAQNRHLRLRDLHASLSFLTPLMDDEPVNDDSEASVVCTATRPRAVRMAADGCRTAKHRINLLRASRVPPKLSSSAGASAVTSDVVTSIATLRAARRSLRTAQTRLTAAVNACTQPLGMPSTPPPSGETVSEEDKWLIGGSTGPDCTRAVIGHVQAAVQARLWGMAAGTGSAASSERSGLVIQQVQLAGGEHGLAQLPALQAALEGLGACTGGSSKGGGSMVSLHADPSTLGHVHRLLVR